MQVRDYRNCTSEQGTVISASNVVPILHKVRLRMSLENVVKDMPLIADDSWTYSDLMVSMPFFVSSKRTFSVLSHELILFCFTGSGGTNFESYTTTSLFRPYSNVGQTL